MKKMFFTALIFTMILSLMACNQVVPQNNQGINPSPSSGTATPTNTLREISVFYADEFNQNLVSEKRQISFLTENEKYQNALAELFKGPQSTNMMKNLNDNISVYGVIKQEDSLIVDFSKEFEGFKGVLGEEFGIGSIVNTLTQFPEIKSVKILVNGKEIVGLNDQPRGFMTQFVPAISPLRSIKLYFSDKNATKLIPELRNISADENISKEDLATLVLKEEIKGFDNNSSNSSTSNNGNLNDPLNAKIKVLSVKIKGDLATVDFSKELLDSCQGTTGETLAVDTIINILTDIPEVKKVLIKLEGKTFETGHQIYDKSLTRSS